MTPQNVTAKQYAQWRLFADRRMKTACTVYPVVRTKTSHAGTEMTWPSGTATVCHIYPGLQSSGRSQVLREAYANQLATKMYWTIILPYDTTVAVDYKIVVGGQTFRVIGFPDAQSFLVTINCICEEILT